VSLTCATMDDWAPGKQAVTPRDLDHPFWQAVSSRRLLCKITALVAQAVPLG
jgi:hypothetical protein